MRFKNLRIFIRSYDRPAMLRYGVPPTAERSGVVGAERRLAIDTHDSKTRCAWHPESLCHVAESERFAVGLQHALAKQRISITSESGILIDP